MDKFGSKNTTAKNATTFLMYTRLFLFELITNIHVCVVYTFFPIFPIDRSKDEVLSLQLISICLKWIDEMDEKKSYCLLLSLN